MQFKAHGPGVATGSSPLVNLAYNITEIALSASEAPAFAEVASDPAQIRKQAFTGDRGVDFEKLLAWTWGAGIAVVPLLGKGTFVAAVWRVHGTPVVTLKESRDPSVYWLFDLAHELGHLASGHVTDGGMVDVDSPRPVQSADHLEQAANDFALELLLPDHRALLDEVRTRTGGNYLQFKGAVAAVASKANVNPGMLGMVAAYEMTDVGEDKDRWGSATNLARSDGSGRAQAVRTAQRFLDLNRLSEIDAALVSSLVLAES